MKRSTCHRMPCLVILLLHSVLVFSGNGRPRRAGNEFVCGTGPARELDALARARYHEDRMRRLRLGGAGRTFLSPGSLAVQQDVGDVAVMEDDGTLIQEPNAFDLAGKSFRFEPAGSSTYRVVATAANYEASGGVAITRFGDDDSRSFNIGFGFAFFGVAYDSVQINSDGNLTFLQPDDASTDRDLGRFTYGPPRIGPFFADLNPEQGGIVSYRRDPDGFLVGWDSVPEYSDSTPTRFNSFSVKLYQDGKIEFVYGKKVTSTDAVVGISPGGGRGGISAISYSSGLPTAVLSGTIVESFANLQKVSESGIARKFLEKHPDSFDHLNLFLGFDYDLGAGAYAYELNVKNEIVGIGLEVADHSSAFGSGGRLRSFLNMGTLSGIGRYPDDPYRVFLGTNNTMGIMGQESGHRWLAFTPFRDGILDSKTILGRDDAHWSFFFNSEGSVMEGNEIQDRGADKGSQRFATIGATYRYSRFDQYIIGLIGKDTVPPSFLVENPTGTFRLPASNPHIGDVFGGFRKDISIDSIIAANGARVPSVYEAPKVFRQGFIYLVKKGQTADPAQVAKVQRIRDAWADFFNKGTDGHGWIVTDLQEIPGTTPATLFFPYFQGTGARYTGIAVANWGTTPADIRFQAYGNDGFPLSSPANIINPRVITVAPGGQIAMLAEQIHGLSLDGKRNGWIQAQSTSRQVSGFFLDGDISQTQLSGAVAGSQTHTLLYFMRAQLATNPSPDGSYRNLIDLVNPGSTPAQLTLALFDEFGNVQESANRSLPARGRIAEDLTSLFHSVAPSRGSGYVKVTSDAGLVGYQSIDSGKTIFALPGLAPSAATTLYSAQFASGASGPFQYFSDLVFINTSAQSRNIQVLLVNNSGVPAGGFTNPITFRLSSGQQLRTRGESLFGLPDASISTSLVEGSLVVTADGSGIIGDVTFGDALSGKFLASLPFDGSPAADIVLSQVAEGNPGGGKPYFTGVAMYNSGANDTRVTIDVFSGQGIKTGSSSFILAKGNRLSRTLPQYVPAVAQQTGGYIRIKASPEPIVVFELFGTQALDFLAAVPPQPVIP